MKAAVCYEFGKPLRIEDVALGAPGKGEVRVRIAATAICHTDIHIIRGQFEEKLPLIAGHESSGYVEEIGEGVTSVKPGDTVVVSLLTSCGKCYHCLNGLWHLCDDNSPMEKESPLRNKNGQRIEKGVKVAGFAEYINVDESQLVPISNKIPMDKAALLGCGVITGFGAVIKRAQVKPFSSVVVLGTGGVGLNAVQGASFAGAYPIIAVDISDDKLQTAFTFGATHGINARVQDPVKVVSELTQGKGADYVFVTTGSIAAIKQGFAVSGKRGMTVIIGLPSPRETWDFSPFEIISSERIITGSYMGSTNTRIDIPELVDLYLAGKIKLDELITGHYPLERINEAIESVESGHALRNVIIFE